VTRAEAGEPDRRDAILDAAMKEFAEQGFAGARTKAIARKADVNIALMYYHYQSKEKLYAAVLERVFVEWARRLSQALQDHATATEKLVAYVEAYFDFVAEAPERPRLVQQEMMQLGCSEMERLNRLAKTHVRPTYRALLDVLRQGHRSGEFREVSPDFAHSIGAIIVTYFTSSTFVEAVTGHNPLTPHRIAQRRKSVLDTILASVLDRGAGRIRTRKEKHA